MPAIQPAPHFVPLSGVRGSTGFILIACAHIAIIWGLWQLSRTPLQALASPVLSVFLLPAADQSTATPAPSQRPEPPRLSPLPAALPVALSPEPALNDGASAPTVAASPAVHVAPAPAAPATPAAQQLAPPTPPAAAPRRQVSASAVRYLSLPPVEVPRASRRAGEHGTVWLRVVVDTAGLPVQVSVERSSGFARLDEQALWAMRQARFKAHTEDGRAVEVEVIAPIEYPAD